MNKIDKPEANPDNVKQGLCSTRSVPEEWGGETSSSMFGEDGDGLDLLMG